MAFDTNTWCTPRSQAKLIYEFWPKGIGLDPFYNKSSCIKAKTYYDLKKKQDAYKLPWKNRTFANGPYSNPYPKLTAERCAEFAEEGLEILNLCPAAIGSAYWIEFVWPHAVAFAALGRLPFEAPCDIYDDDGYLILEKGEPAQGNRTEIAMVYYGEDVRRFKKIWEKAGFPVSIISRDELISKQVMAAKNIKGRLLR